MILITCGNDVLDGKEITVREILDFQICKIIDSVHSQITFKETFKNPWWSQAAENIYFGVFYERLKAIEDFHTHFGRATESKRYKKKKPMKYTLNFTHFECLKFQIEKIIGKDKLAKYFEKENKREARAKVVVNKAKPAIMGYELPTGSLTLSVNYEV